MHRHYQITGCAIVLLILGISAVRYLDVLPKEVQMYQFSAADFAEPLKPAQKLLLGERIDINAADAETFEVLHRIGPVLAARIVADREANGPFVSVDDLKRVHGIGPKTIQKNRHYLKISP